ncbi:UDP-glycosyltransferase UGT5-like [Danaus plexippus]|uniref:UDP-glycosyltransferase UGT5-like n=1 Tax=Danaus plexippus TaxID=13037 RepID=UPI002AB271B4|nr:UDP-glycosyltransferase UGT5-like [Danaus plexippus]
MTKYIILFYIVSQLFAAQSYKILGIFPSADRGNYQTYRGLFRQLTQRNHHVTLITHFQMPNPPVNYHEVLLSDKQDNKGLSFESVIVNEVSRVPFETLVSTKEGNDDCKTLMNNHEVLHMIRTQPKYSVIIVESYNSDCALALAANLSSPYIAFNPQSIHPWHFSRLGIHFNSAYVPQSLLPFGKEPWFFDRVKGFILYHVANWVYYIGSQVTDHVYLYKYLGDNLPALESIASNASLVFVNTHKSVFGGVVRADNVVDIGGIHIRPPKSIPTHIERFINEAENGVIYVNLGSTVKDFTLPSDKLTELISTFRKLQLRILWKWDGDSVENLPRNVMTMKWFPQYDILKHDNVKAFISHGGILSCTEALDAGVPVVAIPLFGEQYGNSAALVDAGIASIVTYENLKDELLLDAINEVLEPRCQQQAKLVSRMWHDRPMNALETAIYWIEYVARYNGSPNMGAPSVKVPWYQQLQLDVLAFIFIVFYIVMYAFYKVLKVCCCCCCQPEPPVEKISRERTTRRVKFE